MRKVGVAFAIVLFLCLVVLNGVAVLIPEDATAAGRYMAGSQLVDENGQTIGCSCPVLSGSCICKVAN